VSQDPEEFAAGDINLYRYVGNDPTNQDDPSGNIDDKPAPWEYGFLRAIEPIFNQTKIIQGQITGLEKVNTGLRGKPGNSETIHENTVKIRSLGSKLNQLNNQINGILDIWYNEQAAIKFGYDFFGNPLDYYLDRQAQSGEIIS
jgi:hypothetical protein